MAKTYNATYVEKSGLFSSRKLDIFIALLDNKITGRALNFINSSTYKYERCEINYDDIINYEEYSIENYACLKIDVRNHNAKNDDKVECYVFPLSPYKISSVIDYLEEHISNFKISQKALIEEKQETERLEQQFYNSIYEFHIKEETPIYTIYNDAPNCFVIYMGEDKSLNFLLIEAKSKTEIHSVIKYDEIHYYEKAGAVHYTTNINTDYTGSQSFGGSFVGARVSVGAAVLGGLLFGAMGMAIGTMASYKPAEYTPPTYTPSQLNISSEITKIDERSVILNYYSEQKKQYVDIELPQEIFNFLQTFLPDKKYAIVLAKETQDAVQAPTSESAGDDTIARLKKLKELYEMELISETEYAERKKEILADI